jgi:hypothetical protein
MFKSQHLIGTMPLTDIRAAGPCGIDRSPERTGFRLLLHAIGEPDVGWNPDRRVSLGDIARSNGAPDAWWCVRAMDWRDIAVRRAVISVLLVSCRRAAVHTTDSRALDCLDALTRWCAGDDSVDLAKVQQEVRLVRAAASAAARWAADAAAWASVVRAEELELQITDILTAFPPICAARTTE